MNERMCYVAEDPDQPGAAFAASVIAPGREKDNAKCVADWIRRGATVRTVTSEAANEMLGKWKRPGTMEMKV